eukprot:gene4020-2874_t
MLTGFLQRTLEQTMETDMISSVGWTHSVSRCCEMNESVDWGVKKQKEMLASPNHHHLRREIYICCDSLHRCFMEALFFFSFLSTLPPDPQKEHT